MSHIEPTTHGYRERVKTQDVIRSAPSERKMKTANPDAELHRLIGPLGDCLTPESARRVLALKADRKLQARVDYLADRCSDGLLTSEEHAEYNS
jgi:hypothetical protein